MTMDDKRCVVDTNVLVHGTVRGGGKHEEAREWLTSLQRQGATLCVTTQILREYLAVLTSRRFFEKTFTPDEAVSEVEGLLPSLRVLDEPTGCAALLRDLVRRYEVRGAQIHDANIVAVMLYHGVPRIATYNRSHFGQFHEVSLEPV